MEVWKFNYCHCIYESADETISIHKTKIGAEKAMEIHKDRCLKKFKKTEEFNGKEGFISDNKFGEMEHWSIQEVEVLE